MPSGWTEIRPGSVYSGTGATLLTVFVFDENGSTPRGCVNTVLRIVANQSAINDVRIDPAVSQVAGVPAVVAVADGFSSTGRSVFRGVYAGMMSGQWVYVFAWDAFGDTATQALRDDATFTLDSITIR